MKRFNLAPPQINPIIVREVRSQMRGIRPYAILTFFLLALVAVGYGIYQLMLQQARFNSVVLSATVGQALFNGLTLCELFLVVFLAPALTSGAISGEREQLTYDMLMATPLRPSRLLWGKLFAALSYIFLLVLAAIPVFSVVLMFGGVAPGTMLKALVLLVVAAITFGSIGLFCSALMRRTSRATVLSYSLILLLIGGTTVSAMVWGQFSTPPGQQPPPPLLYMNPFSALVSIVSIVPSGDAGPFMGFNGDMFSGLPLFYLLSPGVIYYGANGPVVLPIYRATLTFLPILTALLLWISSHLVLPRRRWLPRWSDLGFLVLLAGLGALAWFAQGWWFITPPV